jgi:hypothetical protein
MKEQSQMGSSNPLIQKEWGQLQATLPRGSNVKGRVVSVQTFGVFVDIALDPRIPVLLEIIHFKIREDDPEHRISFPQDYPAVGNQIEARILTYSMKPHTVRVEALTNVVGNATLKRRAACQSRGTCIMNSDVANVVPGRAVKLLTVLSVAFFWLLPFSPMVAIGAVSMTKGACGRWRKLAVTGAALCTAYTVAMALLFLRVYLQIII